MRVEFDKRRKVMVKRLARDPGRHLRRAQGGAFYAFPDLSAFIGRKTPEGKTIDNDAQLCEYLIEAARVAVVPGSAFGAPGYVRLSYATSMKNVEEGVAYGSSPGPPRTLSSPTLRDGLLRARLVYALRVPSAGQRPPGAEVFAPSLLSWGNPRLTRQHARVSQECLQTEQFA